MLIEAGADIDAAERNGCTALHRAVARGPDWPGVLEICRHLIDAGANIYATDDRRRTPLSMASQAGCSILMKLFLARKAEDLRQELERNTTQLTDPNAVEVPKRRGMRL
jgi:ankyrin repeat protein